MSTRKERRIRFLPNYPDVLGDYEPSYESVLPGGICLCAETMHELWGFPHAVPFTLVLTNQRPHEGAYQITPHGNDDEEDYRHEITLNVHKPGGLQVGLYTAAMEEIRGFGYPCWVYIEP